MRLANRAAWLILSAAVFVGCAEPPPPADVKVDLTIGTTPGVEAFIQNAKGSVVLVDFWATWCGPCVKKFPALVKLHQEYGPKG
jgi:thiol-disulfide isomerase/thioredoxin